MSRIRETQKSAAQGKLVQLRIHLETKTNFCLCTCKLCKANEEENWLVTLSGHQLEGDTEHGVPILYVSRCCWRLCIRLETIGALVFPSTLHTVACRRMSAVSAVSLDASIDLSISCHQAVMYVLNIFSTYTLVPIAYFDCLFSNCQNPPINYKSR